MDERAYLERLKTVQAAAWPKTTPRQPTYPHGERPLTEYLREWAKVQPDKPAVIFYGHTLTYGDFDRQSDRFAALLARHGVKKGDRVAVFLPNSPQFHIVFFGILKLGAVHVPVSPLSRAFELAYELTDTGAETIVALDTLMPIVREVKSETKLRTVFVTSFADVLPDAPTIPVPATARESSDSPTAHPLSESRFSDPRSLVWPLFRPEEARSRGSDIPQNAGELFALCFRSPVEERRDSGKSGE